MEDTGKEENLEQMNTGLCVDRISSLPLPLIYHIFSFLPTQYVVQTCILSKSWRNIWCSAPSVNFRSHVPDFFKFVDAVLLLRDASNIQRFSLFFSYGETDDLCRIHWWLIYAVRHNVEVLDIKFTKLRSRGTNLESAPHIFDCKSLQELSLSCSLVRLPTLICLPALNVLKLYKVEFKDGQVEQVLFSVSPSLETLVIKYCCFKCRELAISMPKLKNLLLKGYLPSSIDISAPNILSLELNILNSAAIRFCRDANSIVSACLKLEPACSESIMWLFMVLKNVRSLKLSYEFLQSFIVELQKDLSMQACIQTPFYNMEWLKIRNSFRDGDIFVINVLLQHSPKIETIFLKNTGEASLYGDTTKGHFEIGKMWYDFELPHLKLVEIRDFEGSENEMMFVKFILKNAMILEKLIITSSKACNIDKVLLKVGKTLLSYPRASSSVGILIL